MDRAIVFDKTNKVSLLYGYLVCLIAIVAILISATSLISAAFDLSNPLIAENFNNKDLSSFEAYKSTYQNPPFDRPASDKSTQVGNAPTEEQLKSAYEAAKTNKIATVKFRAWRTITTSLVVIIFAILLFTWHWRWASRLAHSSNNHQA
jgi:hypothetical protein